jgi:hypothetical protein
MNIIKLLFILISLSVVLFGLNEAKRQHQEYDDNEFDEFDSFDAEEPQQTQTTKKPNDKPKSNTNDFDDDEDDGFVKTELFDEEEIVTKPKPKQAESQKQERQTAYFSNGGGGGGNLGDDLDMEEFEHFVDDEEFEGATTETISTSKTDKKSKKHGSSNSNSNSDQMPNLKIADVPKHLMTNGNWQNYVWEIVMLMTIFVYFGNFLYGKSRNYRLAQAWFQSHRELLERNFSVVGDDGTSVNLKKDEVDSSSEHQAATNGSDDFDGKLIKDSENSYGLWCTGRQTCDGMLAQLKLVKRQDLINGVLMQMIKPQSDQIILSIEYPAQRDTLDSFVFCLTNKKQSKRLFEDYQDLSSFCSEKKLSTESTAGMLGDAVASKYAMLNESSEIPNAILDVRVCAFLNKYPDMVEYLLISDQYVGYKVQINDDQSVSGPTTAGSGSTGNEASPISSALTDDASTGMGLPKSRPILILCLNVPGKGFNTTPEDMELMQPALQLALYLIEKVPRIRLSKEAKAKAIKKRKGIAEQFMKLSHKQRQEAVMLRKEEKRRADKDRIMNEEDPEKQKRLEEKEIKREKKRNLSKMKQVKIKSM